MDSLATRGRPVNAAGCATEARLCGAAERFEVVGHADHAQQRGVVIDHRQAQRVG
jgi:hypothetical protein